MQLATVCCDLGRILKLGLSVGNSRLRPCSARRLCLPLRSLLPGPRSLDCVMLRRCRVSLTALRRTMPCCGDGCASVLTHALPPRDKSYDA